MTKLRKVMTSALAATMLVGTISVATPAAAWSRYGWGGGWGYGGAAAAGLLGGLALGTVAAASPWGYGYPYGGYGYYGAAYPSYGGCTCW